MRNIVLRWYFPIYIYGSNLSDKCYAEGNDKSKGGGDELRIIALYTTCIYYL